MHRYNVTRVRVAISTNPAGQNYLHAGHLQTILFSQIIARNNDIEFHLRIDDMYGKMEFESDKVIQGCLKPIEQLDRNSVSSYIIDVNRPNDIAKKCSVEYQELLHGIGVKFDRVYLLSDFASDNKAHFKNTNQQFLACLPFQFTEDFLWEKSIICRGDEWTKDFDLNKWNQMQRIINNGLGAGLRFIHLPLLMTDNGSKISKSNLDHQRYMISNMSQLDINALRHKVSNYYNEFLSNPNSDKNIIRYIRS